MVCLVVSKKQIAQYIQTKLHKLNDLCVQVDVACALEVCSKILHLRLWYGFLFTVRNKLKQAWERCAK